MNTLEWLGRHHEGFDGLGEDETAAIMEFTILWAFFEAHYLDTAASPQKFVSLAEKIIATGRINMPPITEATNYWRNRYVEDGISTHYFATLHLRDSDNRQIVEDVLFENDNTPRNLITTGLTIVYRYRNNLFHGMKWAYGLRGQKGNFMIANKFLKNVAEMCDG